MNRRLRRGRSWILLVMNAIWVPGPSTPFMSQKSPNACIYDVRGSTAATASFVTSSHLPKVLRMSSRTGGNCIDGGFLASLQGCRDQRSKFAALASKLKPKDIEEKVAEAKEAVLQWVRKSKHLRNVTLSLTGSTLRDVHTVKSDIDFLMDGDVLDGEWQAFADSLQTDRRISDVKKGQKAIEFNFQGVYGSVNVSVLCKAFVSTDVAPMPELQGGRSKPATSRRDVHQKLMDFYKVYPGARDVVRVFKEILDFKGYQTEGMVKQAGQVPDNWNRKETDDSGLFLFEYMLGEFNKYPEHEKRWSFLSYLVRSAKACGQDGHHYIHDEVVRNCKAARKIATQLLSKKYGLAKNSESTSQSEEFVGTSQTTGSELPDFLPSEKEILKVLRVSKEPMTARCIFLVAKGQDPTKTQMGSGISKKLKKKLYNMQREGKIFVDQGLWRC